MKRFGAAVIVSAIHLSQLSQVRAAEPSEHVNLPSSTVFVMALMKPMKRCDAATKGLPLSVNNQNVDGLRAGLIAFETVCKDGPTEILAIAIPTDTDENTRRNMGQILKQCADEYSAQLSAATSLKADLDSIVMENSHEKADQALQKVKMGSLLCHMSLINMTLALRAAQVAPK